MTNEKDYRINGRLNEEQMRWYVTESNNREMTISRFLRIIPTIIKDWEDLMDEKDSIIIKLQEQILELRKHINEMEDCL